MARRPRHQSTGGELAVALVRHAGRSPAALAASLVDFSRQGARLTVACQLDPAEPVVVRFQSGGIGLDLDLAGAVRWQTYQAEHWLVGCQFDEEVSMETLGELFLRGILSHQPTSPSPDRTY